MQAAAPTLPELDRRRHDPIPAPVRRPRRRVAVRLRGILPALLEPRAIRNLGALRRGPGAVARAKRTRREVRIGFGSAHLLAAALDAHLALELLPEQHEARPFVRRQIAALPTLIVGIEHE